MITTVIYTILIPLAILIVSYFIDRKSDKDRNIVNFYFDLFKNYIFYALLLYYLGAENFLNVGLSFVTVMMFTIPLGIIIIPFKLYYFFKKQN